jgi:hypothetical protein
MKIIFFASQLWDVSTTIDLVCSAQLDHGIIRQVVLNDYLTVIVVHST